MNRLYRNYITDHAGYEDANSLSLVLDRDLLAMVPARSARCLDLGCGQGGLSAYLRERGVSNAFGIDISPEQISHAQQLGRDYVAQGDVAEFLRGSEDTWDVITAFDFLEHLDLDAVLPTLEAVRGALNPHGIMIARIPNAAGPLYGRIQFGDFTHKSTFTARSIQQLAKAARFSSSDCREVPPLVHGFRSAARRAIWGVFAGSTRLAIAAESGTVRGHLVTSNIMAYLHA